MRKQRPPSKLFSDFNTLQFASVMGMVLFVILLVFMASPVHSGRVAADMRARWGVVKLALDGVRTAGILRVAYVAYQRGSGAFHM